MDGISCDACGRGLLVDEDVRYVVRIEGFAAYDPLEIVPEDLEGDLAGKTEALLEELGEVDAETAEGQVHRKFNFDLCAWCWYRYARDPLGGVRHEGRGEPPVSEE